MALHHGRQPGQRIFTGEIRSEGDEALPPRRTHRDGQLHGGQRGEAFHCDYAATKGAIISMVKGLSTELARRPHLCKLRGSRMGGNRYVRAGAGRAGDAAEDHQPDSAGPRRAKPEEIAAPIVFLCTPLAGFITGEVFNVNGGAVLVG